MRHSGRRRLGAHSRQRETTSVSCPSQTRTHNNCSERRRRRRRLMVRNKKGKSCYASPSFWYCCWRTDNETVGGCSLRIKEWCELQYVYNTICIRDRKRWRPRSRSVERPQREEPIMNGPNGGGIFWIIQMRKEEKRRRKKKRVNRSYMGGRVLRDQFL